MTIIENPPKSQWVALIQRPVFDFAALEATVAPILEAVKLEGDAALSRFTQQFDDVKLSDSAVTPNEVEFALSQVDESLKSAIALARSNIETFHKAQRQQTVQVDTAPGVKCWWKHVPIEKVGIYIPGGTAPLFSTVLMLAIPARIAGCREVVLCSPPDADGRIHPAILYTAHIFGIEKIYKVGGAQAIAALAYGTETIPRVDKIFGPGNQYVTAAKQLVNRLGVAIDMPAGPTELAVIADATCEPAFVAADLLSQAEHGPDSQVILISPDRNTIASVQAEVEQQLAALPRRVIAQQALTHSKFVLVADMDTAVELANAYAAEHLILAVTDAEKIAERIYNTGSVFLGNFAPESAGDYASGTNHTLPTNGAARAYSGVSVDSFMKKITFQMLTPEGIRHIGPAIEQMAAAEQLQGHKNAVMVRLNKLSENG